MSIRKDPVSGIWKLDIRAPGVPRIRRSTGTTDRKAAQEYHDKLKVELWRMTRLGEEPDHIFDDAALQMLKLSEGQSDYDTKVRHVEYWRVALGAETPVRSLTTGAIMQALPTHTTHKHRKPKPLSNASKNRYLATIRRILVLCEEWNWITRAPKLRMFKEPKQRVRWEPPKVIFALIEAMTIPWMRDVSLFAVATGMREDEILSLSPHNVNMQSRSAWVEAANAKSGHARTVPLNADAMEVLERRLPDAGRFVFARPVKEGAKERKISQIDARCLARACKAVGIKDFRFHDFRHTWASWHVQDGTPLMVLKELGGWERIEMVQKYAHLAPTHLASHAETVTFWSQQQAEKKKAA